MSTFAQELHAELRPLVERLDALEKRFQEKWELQGEKNRLLELKLREVEGELAIKRLEVERLQLDLKKLKAQTDREIERERKVLEEKWALLQREAAAGRERERGALDAQLKAERRLWEEKMVRVQEEHARALEGMRCQESLWTRLIRMMTWN
jgi:hypothetical protein